MTSKKSVFIALIMILSLATIYFFMFTAWGVHVFGEVLFGGEKRKSNPPQDYPTEVDGTLPILSTIDLPPEVMQPSGIDYDPKNQTFYLVTDQAEIIELSNDFQTVYSFKTISNKPLLLRQGNIESTDFHKGKMYVSGDNGTVQIWTKANDNWFKESSIIPEKKQSIQYSAEALAIDPNTGNMYFGDDDRIIVLNQKGQFLSSITLEKTAKQERTTSEFVIAGMDFHEGILYVLTEYYSAILTVDPNTGEIDEVYALEGIIEGAGLAVTARAFFVCVDHEVDEAPPGIKVYKR